MDGQFAPGTLSNQDTAEDGYAGIAPVAQYSPNAYGLYDMAAATGEVSSFGASQRKRLFSMVQIRSGAPGCLKFGLHRSGTTGAHLGLARKTHLF